MYTSAMMSPITHIFLSRKRWRSSSSLCTDHPFQGRQHLVRHDALEALVVPVALLLVTRPAGQVMSDGGRETVCVPRVRLVHGPQDHRGRYRKRDRDVAGTRVVAYHGRGPREAGLQVLYVEHPGLNAFPAPDSRKD